MARSKNYVLGAGKLFFDRFDENDNPTGEFYIGNTTSLSGTTDVQTEEHYSADEAERAKDASVATRTDLAIAFTTDDIQPENLAMVWKGVADTLVTAAATGTVENITVLRGRWYQLGASLANPTGVRSITMTTLTNDAGVPVAVPGGSGGANYEVDTVLGRVFIKEDAPDVADGDILIATFDVAATSREVILSTGETLRGSLRYVADNTQGVNRDDFWPLVQLNPDGDYQFKATSWQEMTFKGEVLKRPGYAKHYTDGRPVAA